MTVLLTGSLLAALALAFVFWPILRGATGRQGGAPAPKPSPESSALEAMREIEFDRATGKLSVEDYDALRSRYAPLALRELDAAQAAGPQDAAARTATDAAERLIARIRATPAGECALHGPRPEGDALFCSECGRALAA